MKIETSGIIRAPIETVFDCLTDIKFFMKEFRRSEGGKYYKVQYDRKDPFGIDKKIFFVLDEPEFIIHVSKNNGRDQLVLIFEPKSKTKEILGTLEYSVNLKQSNDKTKYHFSYTSSKEPVGIFKIIAFFVRLIILFSFWGSKKRFISFVKSKSV